MCKDTRASSRHNQTDNVILQQESEPTHVSIFQLLLHSQPVGLGLLVELLISGAEHPADIVADAHDFAFDAFEVLPLPHRANFFSGCNCSMTFITSCSLIFLSCSFEVCVLEIQSVSALLLPQKKYANRFQ